MISPSTATGTTAPSPLIQGFREARTGSIQYVLACPATGRCAIIDPVLDYDEKSGATATASADAILAHVRERGLTVEWVLDTHPHADHLSAAQYLAGRTGAPTATGAQVVQVQRLWRDIYGLPDLPCDGSQWSRLLGEGEAVAVGGLSLRAMHTPGHTLASVSVLAGDAALVADTLFMPDTGTARCDFPGGDARALWRSIGRILSLPEGTRLFTGHDYCVGGREPCWESGVAEQRSGNVHLREGGDEEGFVRLRRARDATLPMPRLILHALQVNIRGGRLPEPEADGRRYLRIPLDALPGAAW